jgi:hypothetical protein
MRIIKQENAFFEANSLRCMEVALKEEARLLPNAYLHDCGRSKADKPVMRSRFALAFLETASPFCAACL